MRKEILDHGYLEIVETWGSEERIIEAARMSTNKGFQGWESKWECSFCQYGWIGNEQPWNLCPIPGCSGIIKKIKGGDDKLLRYLWENKHHTPFEMAGATIEVQAPIFVFREWHRHRTQCLAPDTLIHFDAPKSRENRHYVYKMRIEDIWKKWQPTQRKERPERQTNSLFPRSRIQAMQLRCLNENDKEIVHTNIVDVIMGEPKPMFKVTTASGRALTATKLHKVFTDCGWMTLGEAILSDSLLALEGVTRGKSYSWEIPPIDESRERWLSVKGWEGFYEVSDQGRIRRNGCLPRKLTIGPSGYPVCSLNKPGFQTLKQVHTLVLEAFVGSKPNGGHARHADHNRADSRLSNLSWGTPAENAGDAVKADRNQRLVVNYEEITSVEYAGRLPTYDLTVSEPWHNFIADGFVVHNSYNELSARYTPMPDVCYRPTPDRMMISGAGNKQAGTIKEAGELTQEKCTDWLSRLDDLYQQAEQVYQDGLRLGVPKELARLAVTVSRYSRMRASANLRNWYAFLKLRQASNAQFEIREYANALGEMIAEKFPRTYALFKES